MQAALHVLEGDQQHPVDPDALLAQGHAERRRGDHDTARSAYLHALQAYADICDGAGEATVLCALGKLALAEGNTSEACARLTAAVTVWRASGDLHALAACLDSLGIAQRGAGAITAARASYAEALRLSAQLGDRRLGATLLVHAAHVEEDCGNQAGARRHLERAAKLFRSAGDARGQAGALASLGLLYRNTHRSGRAVPCFERALQLCDGSDPGALAWLHEQLRSVQPVPAGVVPLIDTAAPAVPPSPLEDGRRALAEGRLSDAQRCAEQTVAEAHALGRRRLAAEGHCLLAETRLSEGRTGSARRALALAGDELGDAGGGTRARLLAALVRADLLDAETDSAQRRAAEAFACVDGDPGAAAAVASALVELGDALLQRGDAETARSLWQQAARLDAAGAARSRLGAPSAGPRVTAVRALLRRLPR